MSWTLKSNGGVDSNVDDKAARRQPTNRLIMAATTGAAKRDGEATRRR